MRLQRISGYAIGLSLLAVGCSSTGPAPEGESVDDPSAGANTVGAPSAGSEATSGAGAAGTGAAGAVAEASGAAGAVDDASAGAEGDPTDEGAGASGAVAQDGAGAPSEAGGGAEGGAGAAAMDADTSGAGMTGAGAGAAGAAGMPDELAGAGNMSGDETAGASAMEPSMAEHFVFTASTDGWVRAHAMDAESGALETVGEYRVTADNADFFLATPADPRTLFVSYNRGVSALSFDPESAQLEVIATGATGGGGTHVESTGDGANVFVAHYNEGALTHLAFDGAAFTPQATLMPGQNAHSSRLDRSESWLYVPCKGSDRVVQYVLAGGALDVGTHVDHDVPGGPRHMVFHPSLDVAYVLGELDGKVHVRTLDPDTGSIASEISAPLLGQAGDKWGSDVQITPNGLHLYAVERNARALYHFTVGTDGALTPSGAATDLGAVVRAFDISPDGRLLQVGDASGNVRAYLLDENGGATRSGQGLSGLGDVQSTLIRAF